MEIKKVFLKIFCVFALFVLVAIVGCKTTAPTLGYIKPSEEILKAYRGRDIPYVYDGGYVDFGKDKGHTTKRVLWVYDQNGNLVYKGENSGTDAVGRILSNVGIPIGVGTAIASPFWGYFKDADRINMSGGGGNSSSTSSSKSGP